MKWGAVNNETYENSYGNGQDAGLSVEDQEVCIISALDIPAKVRQAMDTIDGPTALICADLVGHPLSESTNIIRNDSFKMGEAACDLLKQLISGECSGPISLRLPPELVARTR